MIWGEAAQESREVKKDGSTLRITGSNYKRQRNQLSPRSEAIRGAFHKGIAKEQGCLILNELVRGEEQQTTERMKMIDKRQYALESPPLNEGDQVGDPSLR